MGKQNLLKFLFLCLLGIIPLAGHAQTKLVAWEFNTDNNTVSESKELSATTGTGTVSFYSSGTCTVAADNTAYGNVMFTAPGNPALTGEDWVNPEKHDNYIQVEFSMKGYQRPVISFALAADTDTKWHLAYSTDGGTAWSDAGEFTTNRAWHEACTFSDVSISATDKEKVLFRILNVTNGNRASYDTRFKSFVVMAEEYSLPSYNKETVTATWPFNLGTEGQVAELAPANASEGFKNQYVQLGSQMLYKGSQATNVSKTAMTKIQPKISQSAASADGAVDFIIVPKTGLTFTPTKVSAKVAKFGTDGGTVDVAWLNTDNSTVTLAAGVNPKRNNNAEGDFSDLSYEITDATAQDGQCGLRFYVYSLGNAKEMGFADIVIEGILDGTVAAVKQCKIAVSVSPEGAGTAKIIPVGNEFDENTELSFSQTRNFGYKFVNWTDELGNELSTEETFRYVLAEDKTITANYEKVNTYALTYNVEGGAKDYMVTLTPAPVVVEGKNMYEEGTNVTLAAASNKILTFNNWSNGDTTPEINLVMNQNQDISCTYSVIDFIVGWDFYKTGGNGRIADFSAEENDAVTLVLRNVEGNTTGWLDKSQMGAGGYEGRPAAVNWDKSGLGTYYWQTVVNASAFKDIKVSSAMLYNYNAYQKYDVEYSLNGEDWVCAGSFNIQGAKNWTDEEFTLSEETNNQANLYIRWIADKTSSVDGTASDNDGIAIGNIYITGVRMPIDDGTAPVLASAVPEEGSNTASANGKVVLTFDEKVKVEEGVTAILDGQKLIPTVSGKTVMFEYKGLAYATAYTFRLPANSISDLTDNFVTEDIVINFTTKMRPEVVKANFDFIIPDDGDFKTALAIAAKREDTSKRFRIFIKKGSYKISADGNSTVTGSDGKVYPNPITKLNIPNVSIIGEDMANTSITNTVPDVSTGANPIEGLGKCAVLSFDSNATNTYLQDITIKSGLKDATGRGAALEDGSNKTICKDVCLYGYQDTYLSNNNNGRFYFEGGQLRGRTDYLCGKGDVFYNGVELMICEAGGYLVAPSNPKKYGYIFQDCTIKGEVDGINGNYTLGRPWGSGTPVALYINTTMEVQPSAVGWNEMGDGWPARFAEYNSMTASGTVIDLGNRKTIFGDNHANNPILTDAEATNYTLAKVMGDNDDWDPTAATEQASAPTNVKIDGETLSWDNNKYVLCWAVCKNGNVIAFSTENTFTIDDTTAKYAVRAANEMGGLGEATEAISASDINDDAMAGNEVVSTSYYNLQGMRVSNSYEGIVIKVDTLKNGKQVSAKIVK